MSGPEGREPRYVAHHEAAHAVVGMVLGRTPETVTIRPDDESEGVCEVDWGDHLGELAGEDWHLFVRAASAYAGHVATLRLGFEETAEEAGADQDYADAASYCLSIAGGDQERSIAYQEKARGMAETIVEMTWRTISDVAELLEEEETVSAQELRTFLDPYAIPEWAGV